MGGHGRNAANLAAGDCEQDIAGFHLRSLCFGAFWRVHEDGVLIRDVVHTHVKGTDESRAFGRVVFSPAARAAGDEREEVCEFNDREALWIPDGAAEELEEGGGEEGVAEFEGVAAGAAQPVRLLQLLRDPLLVEQIRERDSDSAKRYSVGPASQYFHGLPRSLG